MWSFLFIIVLNINIMSFTIHEKITTELTFKEIILITSALSLYVKTYPDPDGDRKMNRLSNRLFTELHDHPDNDEPNSH